MSASPSLEQKSYFWRRLLIALGIFAAVGAFFVAVVIILIWQSMAWLKNAAEPNMAQYEPIGLSRGEEEDVARIISGINEAKQNGSVYDEYMTPRVFNGALQRIIDDERRKGTAKPDSPLFVRGAFVGDRMSLRLTLNDKPEQSGTQQQPQSTPPALLPEPKYINAEAVFNLEIVDGEITRANVYKLVLRGREAPWLSRWVVNYFIGQVQKKSHEQKDGPANQFWAIKLLRRENDRLHVVLDGTRMREKEATQEKKR